MFRKNAEATTIDLLSHKIIIVFINVTPLNSQLMNQVVFDKSTERL